MKTHSKKIISLVLALIMCLALLPMTALAADAPSSWAAESVNKAIAENLVPEPLQSEYTQAATRAEFCSLAVALYENVKGAITGRIAFADTTDVNVEKAAAIGVVSGVGDSKFDPDAKLTREQAAVMLSRLAEAAGKPFAKETAVFADNESIASWAIEGVGQVQAAGIMGGIGDNKFAPQDPYTREQSIITIMRTYDVVKDGVDTIFGVWRFEGDDSVELFTLNEDGTAEGGVHYKHGKQNQFTFSGNFTYSDGKIVMTDIFYDGNPASETLGELVFTFVVSGGIAILDGLPFSRVPEKDIASVLADPLAPYPAVNIANAENKTGNLTKELFKAMESGVYHMKMQIIADESYSEDFTFDIYAKDGTVAVEMEVFGILARVIYKDGKSYTVLDEFRTVSVEEADVDSRQPVSANASKLTYIGENTGEFMNNTYKYDEYTNKNGMRLLYFMDNGLLKGIRTISQEGEIVNVTIISIDKNMPDSVFDIPLDYEVSYD